jgi:hypothetical protein
VVQDVWLGQVVLNDFVLNAVAMKKGLVMNEAFFLSLGQGAGALQIIAH